MSSRIFLAIAVLATSFPVSAQDNDRLWGIYSNVSTEHGEPSGMEMFFLSDDRPGKCNASVLFQVSEGWPQQPELVDCCSCSLKNIKFTSRKLGPFNGKVSGGALVGEFVTSKQKVTLEKGLSFWQK